MSIVVVANEAPENVKDYAAAINFAGQKLIEKDVITPEYITACIERETDFPTGLELPYEDNVAMPHGNSAFVKKNGVSFVRAKNRIVFGSMEDKNEKVECSFIFNLALSSGEEHLNVLKKLIRLFQNEDFIKLCREETIDNIRGYIGSYLEEK